MKTFVKTIAILLVSLMLLSVCSCGKNTTVTEIGIYKNGKLVADGSDMALVIDGNALSLNSYAYFYFNEWKEWQSSDNFTDSLTYADYFASLTLQEKSDLLKSQTLTNISEYYAKENLFEQYQIKVTDEINSSVASEIELLIKQYGTEADYESVLKNNIFSDKDSYKEILIHYARESKLIALLYQDEIYENARNNYYCIEQIAVTYNEGDSASEAAARSAINQALSDISDGKSFISIAKQVNNGTEAYDNATICISKSNTLVSGDSVSADFTNVAKALNVDEVSDVVQIDGAYRIFKRVAITDEYIANNVTAFISTETYALYNTLVDNEAAKVRFELKDAYNMISYTTFMHPSVLFLNNYNPEEE